MSLPDILAFGSLAQVELAHGEFSHANPRVFFEDTVGVVLADVSAEEVVVDEVEGIRQAFVKAQALESWHRELWPSERVFSHEVFLLHANLHHARKASESITKVLSLLYALEKPDVEEGAYPNVAPEYVQPPAVLPIAMQGNDQRELGLPESFVPSVETVSVWTAGLKELALEAGRKGIDLALARASARERAHEFASMFRSTVGSFAQYTRYEGGDRTLVSSGRVAPNFQRALYQQFELVPDRAVHFLKLLVSDFVGALKRGWQVEGEWGAVRMLSNGDVVLDLKPVELFEDPDFVESEDVE